MGCILSTLINSSRDLDKTYNLYNLEAKNTFSQFSHCPMYLLEIFKKYLLSQQNPPSQITVKNYLSDVRKFISWFQNTFNREFAPEEITEDTLNEFKNVFKADNASRSLERYLSSLRKFFHFLKLEGKISSDPFEKVVPQSSKEEDPFQLKAFKNFLYVYNASDLTIKNYIIDVKQFFTWAKQFVKNEHGSEVSSQQLLASINNKLFEAYRDYLHTQNIFSPSSINRKLSSLRKYSAWALEQGYVQEEVKAVHVAKEKNREFLPASSLSAMLASQPLTIAEKTEEKVWIAPKTYSKFPPIRLLQKSLSGLDFLIEKILVTPIFSLINLASNRVWKMQGKPVFTAKKWIKILPKSKTVANLPKTIVAPQDISLKDLPWYRKIWFHLQFTRPEWYKRYHRLAIARYFNLSVLVIFLLGIVFGLYSALVAGKQARQYAVAAPVVPMRILSFQGRLTDSNNNPITTPTNMRFEIYSDPTASGSSRLWEEVDKVSPDTDGIFSLLLGSNGSGGNASQCNGGNPPTSPASGACGIPQSIFAQNSTTYLGVTVENTAELTPRQQIATVGYATNAEVLQGMPPTTDSSVTGNANTVLALNSSGVVSIAGSTNATTVFQAAASNIKVTGQTTILATNTGSGGDIQLNPDGLGKIDVSRPLQNVSYTSNISTALGAVEIDSIAAILATSSGQSAFTINQNSTGPLISASTSGVAKFTIDNLGNQTLAGTITSGSYTTAGGVLYGSTTGLISQTTAGLSTQCLIGGTTPTWSSCSSLGTNYWNLSSGALSPFSNTADVLIGSTATSSAKFGFINVATGTPTATISAGTTGAIVITASGNITTTAKQSLTLGDSNTGNVQFFSNANTITSTGNLTLNGTITSASYTTAGGIFYGTSTGQVALSSQGTLGQCLTSGGSGAPGWAACGGSGSSWWTVTSGALYPINQTLDLLVGATSAGTSSAKFAVTNVNSGTPTASLSAGAAGGAYLNATGTLATTTKQSLTLGDSNTGNIQFYNSSNTITSAGNLTLAGSITLPSSNTLTGVSSYLQASNGFSVGGATTYHIDASGNAVLNNVQASNYFAPITGGTAGFWQLASNVIAPSNTANDIAVGGNSTSSAAFQVFGETHGSIPAGTASTSGQLSFRAASNQVNLLNNSTLGFYNTVGGDAGITTSTPALFINNNGNIGISTTSPTAPLQIAKNGNNVFLGDNTNSSSYISFNNQQFVGYNGTYAVLQGVSGHAIRLQSSYGSTWDSGTQVTIQPYGAVTIGSTTYGNAALVVNQQDLSGSGDILSASTAGVTKFTIDNSGNQTLSGTITSNSYTTAGGIFYGNASGTLGLSSAGLLGQCLISGAAGAPSWATCSSGGSGTNWWTVTNGALYPINQTFDFLVGATSTGTSSAKFAVTNVSSGTPVASLSAGTTGGAYLSASGTLATSTKQSLTLGDSNTGNIQFYSSANTLTSAGNLTLAGQINLPSANSISGIANAVQLSGGVAFAGGVTYRIDNLGNAYLNNIQAAGNIQANNYYAPITGGTAGFWQLNSNVIAPSNTINDLAIGGTSSQSASFHVYGSQLNNPAASVSANTNYAGLVVSNNIGDLLTASASGATRFAINNQGNVVIGTTYVVDDGNGAGGGNGVPTLTLNNTSSNKYPKLILNGPANGGSAIEFYSAGSTQGDISYLNGSSEFDIVNRKTGPITFQNWTGSAMQEWMRVAANGTIGIGTTSPLATLDVRSNLTTTPVASISGATGKATLLVDNSGVGDLFAASTSGVIKFALTNSGNLRSAAGAQWQPLADTATALQIANAAGSAFVNFDSTNKRVSIGTTSFANANSTFEVVDTTATDQQAIIAFGDGTSANRYQFLADRGGGGEFQIRSGTARITTQGDLSLQGGNGISSLYIASTVGNVGIGTTTNLGNAQLVINQRDLSGNGDILTASAAGTTKFTIANSGAISDANYTTGGGLLYTNGSGAVLQTAAGISLQCLLSTGGGTPTWGGCGAGGSSGGVWVLDSINGDIYPLNSTLDVLIGGTATSSSKFAFTGVAGGTPTASISAQNAAAQALAIGADGTIQAVRNGNITIGGTTTGNITLSPLNGGAGSNLSINSGGLSFNGTTIALSGVNPSITNTGVNTLTLNSGSTGNLQFFSSSNTLSSTGNLTLAGTITLPNSNTITGGAGSQLQFNGGLLTNLSGGAGTRTIIDSSGNVLPGTNGSANLGATNLYWNNVYANNLYGGSSGTIGFWQLNNQVISPSNSSFDLEIGGSATNSGTFQVFAGANGSIPAGTASTSGQLTFTASANQVNLLNNSSLGFYNSVGGDTGINTSKPALYIANNGDIGIGTTNPTVPLQVLDLAGTSGSGTNTVFFGQDATGNKNAIRLWTHDSGSGSSIADIGADFGTGGSGNNTNLAFATRNGGGALTEWMRITNSGNVGIGTTNPSTTLQVTGTFSDVSSATTTTTASISATSSTTGNIFSIVPANPSTALTGNLINVASANHTYMTLTNQDLTIGGHKNNLTISNVSKVYIYDTNKDADGGAWTNDSRAQTSTWYNETLNTSTRGSTSAFPKKAILVAAGTSLYIYDAKDNSLWMTFTGGGHNMLTNPSGTITSLAALNGEIYVGLSSSGTSFGLDIFNFIQDKSYAYGVNTIYFSGSKGISQRNTSGSGDAQPLPNGAGANSGIVNQNVNDVTANMVNGQQFFAVATNGGTNGSISLWNESAQSFVANFTGNVKSAKVWLTSTGTLYAAVGDQSNPSTYAIKVKYNVQSISASTANNNQLFDEVYGYYSNNDYGATTTDNNTFSSLIFTNGPSATTSSTMVLNDMFVTEGTSTVDGKSDTIYLAEGGSGGSMAVIQAKRTLPWQGSIKYYNNNYITDDMVGDVRGFWPLKETSGNVSDVSPKGNTLTAVGGLTYSASGVRDTAVTFNGTTGYFTCTNAACGGTSDLDPTGTIMSLGAWIKTSASGTQMIISKFNSGVSGSYYLALVNGNPQFAINGLSPNLTGSRSINDGNWHYVVGTYDGANMKLYVDGQLNGQQARTGNGSSSTADFAVGIDFVSGVASNFFNGTIDQPFFTVSTYTASEIARQYVTGINALHNHASTTIRGVTIAADSAQKIYGTSTDVKAVAVSPRNDNVYIGTGTGGISVIGLDSDTINDLYNSSINTPDDTSVSWNSNNNFINSIAVGQSYGNGMSVVYGSNNGGTGGVWMETANTTLKDFLATNYNPFGFTLNQSTVNVDSILRVTNPLSTSLNNIAFGATASASLADAFRVDSSGNFLSRSMVDSTTAMQFQSSSSATVLDVDTKNGRVGIGTTAPGNLLTISTNIQYSSSLAIQTQNTNQQSAISFGEMGNDKWQMGKDTDNSLFIWDDVAGHAIMRAIQNSYLTLQPTSWNVGIGAQGQSTLGNAELVVNQTGFAGSGDIITASNSGTTEFRVLPSGQVQARSYYDLDDTRWFLDPSALTTSMAVQGSVGIGTTTTGNDKLSINLGSSATVDSGVDITGSSSTFGDIGLFINNTGTGGHNWSIESTNNASGYGGDRMTFRDNLGTPTMTLNGTLVGIGTTSPAGQLETIQAGCTWGCVETNTNGLQTSTGHTTADYTLYMGADKTNALAYIQSVHWGTATSPLTLNARGGNVGVGTSSSFNHLVIVGDGTGLAQIGSSGCGGNYVALTLWRTSAPAACTDYNFLSSSTDNNLYINKPSGNTLYFRTANNNNMHIDTNGQVTFDNGTQGTIWSGGSSYEAFITSTSNFYITDTAHTAPPTINVQKNQHVCISCYNADPKILQVGAGCLNIGTNTCGDVAEYYHSSEPTDKGDIITIDNNSSASANLDTTGKLVKKASVPYDRGLIGAVSTNPAITIEGDSVGLMAGGYIAEPLHPAVAEIGKVPVKVSTINGVIHSGDRITSSTISGVGMKATKPGVALGPALEDFDPSKNLGQQIACPPDAPPGVTCGLIYVYMQSGQYDPNVELTDTTGFSLQKITNGVYQVLDSMGNVVNQVEIYSKVLAANIQTGLLDAQEITTQQLAVATNNITVAGQSLQDYIISVVQNAGYINSTHIISPLAEIDTIHTNIISPLSQTGHIALSFEDNTISVKSGTATNSAVVAQIDNAGNATFSGSLKSENLAVNSNASVSGTLYAHKIVADDIEGLAAKVGTLSAQNITNVTNIYFATPSSAVADTATGSGQNLASNYSSPLPNGYTDLASFSATLAYVPNLNATTATFTNGLMSLGPTSLNDTTITGQLSIGSQLILANNAINVLGGDLLLQPLAQGGVQIAAGQVRIDASGNLTVNGKATFNNSIATNVISPLPNQDLTVALGTAQTPNTNNQLKVTNSSGSAVFAVNQLGDFIASGTATIEKLNLGLAQPALALSDTEVTATGSAGSAQINSYQKELTIDNTLVTDKSLIYITPVGNNGQIPVLLRQVPGVSFTVGIPVPTSVATQFNWLIVN